MVFFLSSLTQSENYLVKWSSSGLVKDIDQLHNLRAVFTVSVFSLYVCLCVNLLVCGSPLFIQPCYEVCGSLFVEPVFVKLSQKEAGSLYVFTKAVTSI